jgi:tetratricopeptide (TPR) repeat protein
VGLIVHVLGCSSCRERMLALLMQSAPAEPSNLEFWRDNQEEVPSEKPPYSRARAWASIANGCRLRSDLDSAEKAMATALSMLREDGGDLIERAILLELKASLRRDQRRFDDAMSLLDRAYAIFLDHDNRHRAGRALIKKATVHHAAGTPELAIPILYHAIDLIDAEREPFLALCLWHNLIDDLAELGRFATARRLLSRAAPLYRRFQQTVIESRREWVEGKIALGLGQAREAECHLVKARDFFLQAEIPYDAALVSLDLVLLYARQRRRPEIRSLAEAILQIFASQGIRREALATLICLKQATSAGLAS